MAAPSPPPPPTATGPPSTPRVAAGTPSRAQTTTSAPGSGPAAIRRRPMCSPPERRWTPRTGYVAQSAEGACADARLVRFASDSPSHLRTSRIRAATTRVGARTALPSTWTSVRAILSIVTPGHANIQAQVVTGLEARRTATRDARLTALVSQFQHGFPANGPERSCMLQHMSRRTRARSRTRTSSSLRFASTSSQTAIRRSQQLCPQSAMRA